MTELEREICARVKTIRKAIKWPQSSFAQALGITRDQLTNIECGCTPLRFNIASRLIILTGSSPRWIAEGIGPQKMRVKIGERLLEEIPRNCLFSEGWEHWLKQPFEATVGGAKTRLASRPEGTTFHDAPITVGEQAPLGFIEAEDVLRCLIEDFRGVLKSIPPHLLYLFSAQITKAWRDFVRINIIEVCEWEARQRNKQEGRLTETSTRLNVPPGMQSEWTVLKRRLQDATAKPGAKTKLAEFLGVDLTRVSQWLTDSKNAREPGAEYALKMLRWLEQRQRQK